MLIAVSVFDFHNYYLEIVRRPTKAHNLSKKKSSVGKIVQYENSEAGTLYTYKFSNTHHLPG